MLTKEQRIEIGKKVYQNAITTNQKLSNKYSQELLVEFASKRIKAVTLTLQRALNKVYSEVTDAQLLDAKHKHDAKTNGNREERRKAQVAANKKARKAAAEEKKRARIEARKKAALDATQRKNEEGCD